MSAAHPAPQPRNPDSEHALKALVRLLARQAAREFLATTHKEKEVDHDDEEYPEDASQAGASDRSG